MIKLDEDEEHGNYYQEEDNENSSAKDELQDAYDTLGVNKNTIKGKVRKAYLALSMTHHPDKHRDGSEEEKQKHEEAMQKINGAYEAICKAKGWDKYG